MKKSEEELVKLDELMLLVELREQLTNPLAMNNELLEVVDKQLIELLK